MVQVFHNEEMTAELWQWHSDPYSHCTSHHEQTKGRTDTKQVGSQTPIIKKCTPNIWISWTNEDTFSAYEKNEGGWYSTARSKNLNAISRTSIAKCVIALKM